MLALRLLENPIVAFDLETSGAYPIGSDIVEFGAAKWFQGKIVEQKQFLFKPREPMTDFIIKIHGITNEMVKDAPPISEKIEEIQKFLSDCVVMAHHAPFDQGFLAYDFEKHKLSLPNSEVICTSLLSRQLVQETKNHKLQTLVQFFNIDGGSAHRALDDAKSCLEVGLRCIDRRENFQLSEALKLQRKNLNWKNYSILENDSLTIRKLALAIEKKQMLHIVYNKGSRKGELRPLQPIGIVRNPDGDYLMAFCLIDHTNKRFYIEHIAKVE